MQLEGRASEAGRQEIGGRAVAQRVRARHEPAVDQHRRPRHPFGFVACQEQRHGGDIVRLPGAANRLGLREGLLAVRYSVAGDRSDDTTRAYAVYADTILAQFDRGTMGQVNHTRFGSAVDGGSAAATHPRNGSSRDDRASTSVAHIGDGIFDAEEHTTQENRVGAVPILRADFLEGTECAHEAGVVEGNVEATELRDGASDDALDIGLARDVGFLEDRTACVFAAFTHCRFAAVDVQIGNYHRRALGGEADSGGAANTAGGASDYCDFVVEPAHGDAPPFRDGMPWET